MYRTHCCHQPDHRTGKVNNGKLAEFWLDLSNAYGTVPHKLVELTLLRYHVPENFRILLEDYYSRFRIRFSVGDYTTDWQNLKIGIIMGCIRSVIVFAAAINLLIEKTSLEVSLPSLAKCNHLREHLWTT